LTGALRPLDWARALAQPELSLDWTLADWDRVVRLSRHLRLLGRLAERIEAAGLTSSVPEQVAQALTAERQYTRWRTSSLLWLLDRLAYMLRDAPYPLVLLKGAAYIGQSLPIAMGRMPSDADVLVPRNCIEDAQQRLRHSGWTEGMLDEHDQRYYHEWSHEVPPMQHPAFGLELDLHHNIVPPVSKNPVDADKLMQRLQLCQWPRYQVLHPADQVLHSAAHLFFDSEIRDRVRDLVDLDGLLRHFGAAHDFWEELPNRARELGLAEPLALAVHFCTLWLGTPVPPEAAARIRQAGPGALKRAWLHPLLASLLVPTEPDAHASLRQRVAAPLFLARHHLWRLPPHLLVPHLWHKLGSVRRQAALAEAAHDAR
jgi:hypothetical protein